MSSELHGMALNRALAERLGATIEYSEISQTWRAEWQGKIGHGISDWAAMTAAGIPDWANDAGAALRLCLDIAIKHNWQVEVCPYSNGSYVASFTQAFDDRYVQHTVSNTAPAQAMSLLALAALERNREVQPE